MNAPDPRSDSPGVHLVGSVPLADEAAVFTLAVDALGPLARRLPDGETGERSNWISWQFPRLAQCAQLELVARPQRQEYERPNQFRCITGGTGSAIRFGALGYAAAAKVSYRTFVELKKVGIVPSHVRFQVSLPTPLAPVSLFVDMDDRTRVEPAYEAKLMAELDEVLEHIPHGELAIQWDTAVEFGHWEGLWPTHFSDVRGGILERLVRLGAHVPADVELGYHLCYGDDGHRHFMEPRDAGELVAVANGIAGGVRRAVDWIHLPVPRSRSDPAYFAPLRDLALHPTTEVYLGLVHLTDGVEGTRRRVEAARAILPRFGVATECGLGRRPPDTIPELFGLLATIAHEL